MVSPLFKCRIIFLLLLGVPFCIMSYAGNAETMRSEAGLLGAPAGLRRRDGDARH